MKFSRKMSRFTLIELLVVISVIAILTSILLPALNSARQKAKGILCVSTLRQFSLAFSSYNGDWNSWYPGNGCFWSWQLSSYFNTGANSYTRCPVTTVNGAGKTIRFSYAYPGNYWNDSGDYGFTSTVTRYHIQMQQIVFPSEKALLLENWDDANDSNVNAWSYAYLADFKFRMLHGNGANFLFADSHAEWIPVTQIGTFYSASSTGVPVYSLNNIPANSAASYMHRPKAPFHWR